MQSRIGGAGGFEPEQVSLLHMAWTQRVGPQSETPEQWLLSGGAGQIPQRLADELGDSIVLKTPVTGIRQVEKGVVVISSALTVKAGAVIVAIPPPLRNRIKFDPVLNEKYTRFSESAPMGSMSKVHAVYEDAFWRKECLSGSAAGNLKTCEFIADCSRPSGKPGVLTSFIAGDRNRELSGLSDEKVKQLVLDDFAYYFGERARHPKDFEYINWNKAEWTTGAFTSYLGLGVWTKCGEVGWRKPVGDIFWAGTETSDRWPGYFDGAVRAGKKSALAVLGKSFLGSVADDRG
jgi:monoamine oxidase